MKPVLTPIGLSNGIWTVSVSGPDTPPQLEVRLGDHPLESPLPEQQPDGTWLIHLRLPPEAINDGVSVLSVLDQGERLGGFVVAAGDLLQDDLRAQVALLRAEVDLLKSTIRRLHGGA